ncbi:MAG: restriction endonuclease subunit S [Bacteroidaceae bacterium]|nr:restriction endonuclease subunit S [Bacteroidaceae bacterium]
MKEGWSYKKLGEVCDTINGLWKGKKPPFVNVGVIRNANFTKDFTLRFDNIEYLDVEERQYSKRKLQKGDLIVEKSGGSEKQPVGRAVLFDRENGEFSFSNFTSVLRIKDKNTLLSEFLYKYLLFIYKRGDTSTMQKATTGIHNIEIEKYLNIDVPCIHLSEQHSIVARLDAAFSHIDALKANAEKQVNEARKLFQAELTECMKPKEGWEEKTLPKLSENLDSIRKPVTKKDRTEGIYPYYGASGIVDYVDNYLFDEDLLCISEDGANLLMRTYPIAFPISGKAWVNNHAHVLRFKCMSTQRYVEYYFAGLKLDEYITGAAQPKLTQKALNSIIISIPSSLAEQSSIVSHLDSLSSHIRKLEELQQKTIAECDALKQAMLKEVFE